MNTTPVIDKASALAARLVAARTSDSASSALGTLAPELRPASESDAYDVQYATIRTLGASIAGWKVGAKSANAPAQGAPLPSIGVFHQPVALPRTAFAKPGLELEIAFTLGRRFDAHSGPYDDATVIGAIKSMHAAIEIVASRFRAWPNIDKLWQLADLQNHGALVVGEGVPYDATYPFVAPSLHFTFGNTSVFDGSPANTAGDPRWLLTWFVNHNVAHGIALEAGTIVTTGTYTGLHLPSASGIARGEINGLPPVQFSLV